MTLPGDLQRAVLARPSFFLTAVATLPRGLYGVIAYALGQRRREIGQRQAIGGDACDTHGLHMIVPGIVIGGSLALGRVIASQLYGIGAADPWVLVSVAAVFVVAALAACAIPTLCAERIPPMVALRDE